MTMRIVILSVNGSWIIATGIHLNGLLTLLKVYYRSAI